MPSDSFDRLWLPRIGPSAAAQLRRTAHLGLVIGPVCLALAVICSFAFGSGSLRGVVLGMCCSAVVVVVLGLWVRSLVRLARELSAWFGVRIRWSEMPRMQTRQFDEWCRKRDLTPRQ